jgi:D-alanine-D-alanine ligase
VFCPVLHGPHGEDGSVQGLFELAAVPYVGAGVAASAGSMDKTMMKALFAQAGLPQVEYRVLFGRDPTAERRILDELGLPVFVKPANLGSSVAVARVDGADAFGGALDAAFEYDRKVGVEVGVDAREIVSVLGNDSPEASVIGEVVPDRAFYDYDSKYSGDSRTELLIPAPVDTSTTQEIRGLGVAAFRAVDACGLARVDFFVERAGGRVLVNEINTMPGFTSISMYPRLWDASGLPFDALLDRLVTLALERHSARARLRTDYGA